jgi:hypothetical protein
VIKNVIGVPSQALQTIFEMESQGTSQKIAINKICSFNCETRFFSF